MASHQLSGAVRLLPHQSDFYHPDLVAASDAVVGKIGYSTLAEVALAGVRYGYVPRPEFRESDVLAAYVAAAMSGMPISQDALIDGSWVERIPQLLSLPRRPPVNSAADAAARYVLGLIDES